MATARFDLTALAAETRAAISTLIDDAVAAERERWCQPVRELLSLLNEVFNYGFHRDIYPGPDWDIYARRGDDLERQLADLVDGAT